MDSPETPNSAEPFPFAFVLIFALPAETLTFFALIRFVLFAKSSIDALVTPPIFCTLTLPSIATF